MQRLGKIGVVLQFVLVVGLVLVFSFISTGLWGGKPEDIPDAQELVFGNDMTVAEFGQRNNLAGPVLRKALRLETKQNLQKRLSEFGLSQAELTARVDKAIVLSAESESKSWIKILVKFGLWILFLLMVFGLIRKQKIAPGTRKWLYLAAVALFGVILGSDPSPMGTVKDAIALFGATGVVFPPRMIALTVFVAMVVVANKFICSWGCQLGTLQDLLSSRARSAHPAFALPAPPTNPEHMVKLF